MTNPDLAAFKLTLQKRNHPLTRFVEALEERVSAGWRLQHFAARPPLDEANRNELVTDVERKFKGELPASLRESVLDFYGIADGFSFVMTPPAFPDLSGEAPEWKELGGPIGYEVFSLERLASCTTAMKVSDDSDPTFEGCLEELYESDLEEGAVPDFVALRYAAFLSHHAEAPGFSTGARYNETWITREIATKGGGFPGGWVGRDGDDQPLLYLDDDEKPLAMSFSDQLAEELEASLSAVAETFPGE